MWLGRRGPIGCERGSPGVGHQRLKVQRVAPRALFVICAGESGAAFERRVFPVQKKPLARVGEP